MLFHKANIADGYQEVKLDNIIFALSFSNLKQLLLKQ